MSFFQVGWSPSMTNNSEIFALKYRPQSFKDLIGHEEITTSIYNSIKINKIANAFLFTGIRGIGKTTFARIVAKALNCEKGLENLCENNFCSNCEAIINSNHIDVLEIDAASRTGVDDVRELIEFSRYGPSIANYKIFIIDEVHMLSKQAFNALLKTLEEPPKYLKFIFATTEIQKIPITVVSRCQRFDLSRIETETLFKFLKSIGIKENKEIEDNALKLIVKISEGSVRDALSLLDRALISNSKNILTLNEAQKIFGYTDKSSYIDLVNILLKGDENSVITHYRSIYTLGVQPINFLNEFLEILYYIKNISNITLHGSIFSLNDDDYKKILQLSKKISPSDILLYWQFTLRAIKEIGLVSNQNLSIEMFLIQLMYLIKKPAKYEEKTDEKNNLNNSSESLSQKSYPVSQLKNINQIEQRKDKNIKKEENQIKNLDELLNLCIQKKEITLKYEIENNLNLVSFSHNKIEISFNEKLSKRFVKDLSEKLYDWTGNRWIILFSKQKGEKSKKEKIKNFKEQQIKKLKNSSDYKNLLEIIPDIELIDIENKIND